MRLRYFPVNAAWAFTYGDSPISMGSAPLFLESRKIAVHEAAICGLEVTRAGVVRVKAA